MSSQNGGEPGAGVRTTPRSVKPTLESLGSVLPWRDDANPEKAAATAEVEVEAEVKAPDPGVEEPKLQALREPLLERLRMERIFKVGVLQATQWGSILVLVLVALNEASNRT